MLIQPYLFFEGRAEEALAFYSQAVGAQVQTLVRYKDNPEPGGAGPTPPDGEKIMHASMRVGESLVNLSDGECRGATDFRGFSLTLVAPSDEDTARWFNALLDGGELIMPLSKTFFASSFGMLRDRFGLHWMVMGPSV